MYLSFLFHIRRPKAPSKLLALDETVQKLTLKLNYISSYLHFYLVVKVRRRNLLFSRFADYELANYRFSVLIDVTKYENKVVEKGVCTGQINRGKYAHGSKTNCITIMKTKNLRERAMKNMTR